MSEPKDFVAALDSNSCRTPLRLAFVTRRTSPAVKAQDDPVVMTYPEVALRAAIAIEALLLLLSLISLLWDAPLEGLADPVQTPNPAKAPWYFLGLQELLHYFPPVVAGVLIPTLVVLALIIIPYFHVNVEAEGFWVSKRDQKMRILAIVTVALSVLLIWFDVYAVLIPTLLTVSLMYLASRQGPSPGRFKKWLSARPLPFWIMTWFLVVSAVLTIIGTFFRGAGWALVWPWEIE